MVGAAVTGGATGKAAAGVGTGAVGVGIGMVGTGNAWGELLQHHKGCPVGAGQQSPVVKFKALHCG